MLQSVENKESALISSYVSDSSGAEPVTLSQAKAWLRVDHNADDDLIEQLIKSVREQGSRILNFDIKLVTRVSEFENIQRITQIPFGPVGDVDEVKLVADDGSETVLTFGADYYVRGGQWKELDLFGKKEGRLVVTYKSGYALADIPGPLVIFLLRALADNYEHRETIALGTISATISAESLAIAAQYNRRAWF